MNKQMTPTLLVAGMCIGGGTIAIPMVFAKLGIIPSVFITLVVWFLNYYPSLGGMELNLRSERGLSLGELGKKFSGRGAQLVGEVCVKVLSYAAMTMYLCGSSSIIHKLIATCLNIEISIFAIESIIAGIGAVLMFFPFKVISSINNVMFMGFTIIFLLLLSIMLRFTDFSCLPWIVQPTIKDILSVCSVIFASFGYQLILHTLRDYCGRDASAIKRSLFVGSFIPAIVYIIWSATALGVIYRVNPAFYAQLMEGSIDVGEFVKELTYISSFPGFQILVWCMSILAILTSFVGVGIGLAESLNLTLEKHIACLHTRKIVAALATITPAYLVAVFYPNAFLKVLGFVGAMVAAIGTIIPTYLLFKIGIGSKPYYRELKKWALWLCIFGGFGIMMIEFFSR